YLPPRVLFDGRERQRGIEGWTKRRPDMCPQTPAWARYLSIRSSCKKARGGRSVTPRSSAAGRARWLGNTVRRRAVRGSSGNGSDGLRFVLLPCSRSCASVG